MKPELFALLCTVATVFLGIIICLAIDRLCAPKVAPPGAAESNGAVTARELFERRLLNSQVELVEEYYGRPFPAALRDLYRNSELLRKRDLVYRPAGMDDPEGWTVSSFLPADLAALQDAWFRIGAERFPFAEDEYGNSFCVHMDTDADPRAVYYVDEDGEEIEEAAASVEAFLEGLQPDGTEISA